MDESRFSELFREIVGMPMEDWLAERQIEMESEAWRLEDEYRAGDDWADDDSAGM